METKVKHPRALAIAKKGDSCRWEMGDYLIEITTKETAAGGSKVAEVADELVRNGYRQWDVSSMQHMRRLALNFPPKSRVPGISWSAHEEAGSPEMLKVILAASKAQGMKDLPKRFVRGVVQGVDADHKAKRKAAQIKAEKAAAKAEAQGDTKRAEHNKARARKLRGAPQRDPSKRIVPKPEDVPMMLVKAKFASDTSTIRAMVHLMDKEVSPHINDLSKAFVVGSVEQLLEIAEAIRKLAAKLNRNQSNKRAHLHAVA